ncbi:VIER F-box protein 2 [Tanacetum coccineum]
MPLSTYLNLGLGELAQARLTVELANRTVKYPKRIAKNVLVGIGKFTFPVDFIILDMSEDIKVPLILERPFLSIARAKIDVYKRKITLRVGEENIIFKSVKPASIRMTKVIKGEFEKIKDVKVEDIPLTCDASLEVFNDEISRLSKMDDDLSTYEVKIANIPCDSKMDNDSEQEADDDIGYDPGDDEVELTDEESSDNDDEIAEVDPDLLTKDIIRFKTYEDCKDDWIYEINEKPWTDTGVWTKPTPFKHTCKPFNYKTGCSKWPTCGWKDAGYCNGGNLPEDYIIGNQLHYQDYEWYKALEHCKLKDEALRNKAIMEGSIKEYDDESRYEQKRQWNTYTNYDDAYEINYEHNKSEELCEIQEQPVCNIRRYMMIKYSFNDDEEYVAVKEDEYDDLTVTRKEACHLSDYGRRMDGD